VACSSFRGRGQFATLTVCSLGDIAFVVEDIEAVVAKLKKKGTELFGEIQNYKKRL
jgi:4-hydroxyphenylpyruvate dioxygenase-like putative hemolysin